MQLLLKAKIHLIVGCVTLVEFGCLVSTLWSSCSQ